MTSAGNNVIQVPLLGRGRHRDPTNGAGLLELAALLSESRWTDRPRSVHPTLAVVAAAVNDRLGTDGCRAAVAFAPWMCATHNGGAATARVIVLACANAALPHAGGRARTRLLRYIQHTGEHLADREPERSGSRLRQGWRDRHAFRVCAARIRRAVGVVREAVPDQPDRDEQLLNLLEDCINAARAARGRPPVHPRLPIEQCPRHIAVVAGWSRQALTGGRVRSYRPLDPYWGRRLVRASTSGTTPIPLPAEPPSEEPGPGQP